MFLKLDRWLLCEDKRSAFCSSLCRRHAWLCEFGSPSKEKVVIVTTTMTFHVPYKYKRCTKRALRGGRGTARPILSIGDRRERVINGTPRPLHSRERRHRTHCTGDVAGGGGLDGSRKSRIGFRSPKCWTCDEALYRLSFAGCGGGISWLTWRLLFFYKDSHHWFIPIKIKIYQMMEYIRRTIYALK